MTTTEEWRLFRCSDCDEDDPYELVHRLPADAVYDAGCDIEECPRCGGFRSFTNWGTVTVTPVPWVQRAAAAEAQP